MRIVGGLMDNLLMIGNILLTGIGMIYIITGIGMIYIIAGIINGEV